jgi:hypothetical protein
MRRLRERHQKGQGGRGRVDAEKIQDAGRTAFGSGVIAHEWDRRIVERQTKIRRLYLAQAKLLQTSERLDDRELGRAVEIFVRSLAPPDTERLALARALRAANLTRGDQQRGDRGGGRTL